MGHMEISITFFSLENYGAVERCDMILSVSSE